MNLKPQAIKLITPVTRQPITLEEAKMHLHVDHDEENDLIEQLIASATDFVSGRNGYTGRVLLPQTWRVFFEGFCDSMILPLPPLINIDSVQYRDTSGNYQTLSDSVYSVNDASEPACMILNSGQSFPSTGTAWDAVKIEFTAGYMPADVNSPTDPRSGVPAAIKAAIKLIVGDLYQNREAQALVNGAKYEPNPTVQALLYPYRVNIGL